MSSRLIAIVLALAIVLAGVTMLVIQFGGSSSPAAPTPSEGRLAPGDKLLDVPAGAITQIVISRPGAADTLAKSEGEWSLLSAGEQRWPLDEARVEAALRLLTEARVAATPDDQAVMEADATTLTILAGAGRTVELKLAAQTLGGQGLAEVRDGPTEAVRRAPRRLAVIQDALHKTFTVGAARNWRRMTLAPRVSQTAVGLRIVGESGTVALKRVSGRWAVIEPVPGPADPEAVGKTLRALESLTVARFFDDAGGVPEAIASGLDNARGRVLVETLVPGPAGQASLTGQIEMAFGPIADPQGKTVAVRVGTVTAAVEDTQLRQISADVTRYLSPMATQVFPADVGEITLAFGGPSTPAATRTFKRTLDGWVESRPGQGDVLQTKDRAAQIDATLQFLAALPAEAVRVDAPPQYQTIGTIRLLSPGGAPLDVLEIGRAPGLALWLRPENGPVFRGWTQTPGSLLALAPELLGATPAGDIKPPDVNK